MSYKELGLKCGIEIHQQLEGKKLFCNCPTLIREDTHHFTLNRKLRAAAGEGGKVDIAAQQEQTRDKTFIYQGYQDTTCLVETDSEPPHEINQESLYTTLQFCKLIKANISPIVQVMRKTVVDGSNTSGFQRTALISRGGVLETSEGKVGIDNISLEEDACKIIKETEEEKTYRLDRLGIPLIEIGTAPDIKSPEQCQETARKLGMLLRSLPGVKRGLGTIRQDVNVSIKGGARIEVKGAQDLRQIPLLVKLEVKRQVELLKLRKEIKKRLGKDIKLSITNLTETFKKTKCEFIKKALKNKQFNVVGTKLSNFAGFLGKEIQPGKRLGKELAEYAKVKTGIGGIIHSDEKLEKYLLRKSEIEAVKKKLKIKKDDAFILLLIKGKGENVTFALTERLQQFSKGIPKEVRKANPDATSSFLRPMPGAARMYPETDVPLIKPSTKNIELPELLEEKSKRYQKEFNLSQDLANYVAKSARVILFEELLKKYPKFKANFIADTLISLPLEIKKKYNLDSEKLTEDNYRDLFKYLNQDKIHKDILLDVLIDMIKGKFNIKNYESLSTEDVHKTVKEIVKKNPHAPFGALMGQCMKALQGKVSGKIISDELKKLL